MTTLKKFINNYRRKYDSYKALEKVQENKIDKNNAIIKRAERSNQRALKKIDNIPYPYWIIEILEYLAKEMLQYFPEGSTYKIMGPHGITSSTSIWIKIKNYDLLDKDKKYGEPYLYSFEVRPDDIYTLNNNTLSMVDRNTNTRKYKEGTIGEINDMNYPSIPISNNITVKSFILMYYPDFKFNDNK